MTSIEEKLHQVFNDLKEQHNKEFVKQLAKLKPSQEKLYRQSKEDCDELNCQTFEGMILPNCIDLSNRIDALTPKVANPPTEQDTFDALKANYADPEVVQQIEQYKEGIQYRLDKLRDEWFTPQIPS